MKNKIIKETIIIMILSILFHSIYKITPNIITSILFPVNESIFEHGKMILTSFMVYTIIEKYYLKCNNTVTVNFLTSIICILLTYLIFTPIYLYILKTNDNLPLTIVIYTICLIVSIIIKNKYLNNQNDKIGIIGFIITYVLYMILTYYPIKAPIFYDYENKTYGIKSSN